MLTAALAVSGAAVFARAQKKVTERPAEKGGSSAQAVKTGVKTAADAPRYRYEFSQPNFFIQRILLTHDAEGRGQVTFERKNSDEMITEPFTLSADALRRISAHWEALRFLDSEANYQAEKKFPHLGTIRLSMAREQRERSAEFNWSDDPNAWGLANEYRRAADQAIAVFDINVARENQPLELPKLVENLDKLVTRGGISDAAQLLPLLRDLMTDERVPLIARNRAGKILNRVEKEEKKKEVKKQEEK